MYRYGTRADPDEGPHRYMICGKSCLAGDIFGESSFPQPLQVGDRISLRDAGERWVSIAETGGHRVTGIGPTPRAAVVASLAGLQPAAVRELLVDLRLLEVSLRIREASAG